LATSKISLPTFEALTRSPISTKRGITAKVWLSIVSVAFWASRLEATPNRSVANQTPAKETASKATGT